MDTWPRVSGWCINWCYFTYAECEYLTIYKYTIRKYRHEQYRPSRFGSVQDSNLFHCHGANLSIRPLNSSPKCALALLKGRPVTLLCQHVTRPWEVNAGRRLNSVSYRLSGHLRITQNCTHEWNLCTTVPWRLSLVKLQFNNNWLSLGFKPATICTAVQVQWLCHCTTEVFSVLIRTILNRFLAAITATISS